MELAAIALNKILTMFCIVIIGIIAFKAKLISHETNKKLSSILLMLVNPALIFMAYQTDCTERLLKGFLLSVLFAFISHIAGIVISCIFIPKSCTDYETERISCIYSNCGFMGIPLINALFGSEGVFYLSAYLAVFNILLWTQGIILMTGKCDSKTILKGISSPTVISVIIGIFFFAAGIRIPAVPSEALTSVSAMNTPLAMIVAGVTIAQTNILHALKKPRLYFVCFLKLLVIPMVSALILKLFHSDNIVTMTSIIEVACPTAASGTLFALRFDKNSLYASEIFALSTIFSAASLPVVIILSSFIK